ncbi:MAG: hypothetical protein ACTSRK_08460 [Promethearchaeota archaeon]
MNENHTIANKDEESKAIDFSQAIESPNILSESASEQIFPIIDNQSFDFSSQESVTRTFSQQNPIEGNSTFNLTTPSNYTLANISVSLDGLGDGYENITIADDANSPSDQTVQAQSFSITRKLMIHDFSMLFSVVKKPITPNITIRRENQTGEILFLRNTTISEEGWLNILDNPLILETGQYFVVMNVSSEEEVSPNTHWLMSTNNFTLTLYYDTISTNWEIGNFDLGLFINATGVIEDKSAIDVFINNQICIYKDDIWTIDLSQTIENDEIILAFTINISLIYTYDISCSYFRFTNLEPNTEIIQGELHFNFSLDLVKPSSDYLDYQVILNNIFPDYFNINILNDTSEVNYERISPKKIEFSDWAHTLEFVSLNALEQFDVIHTNYVGDVTNVNITTDYSGNIYWSIYENEVLVHSQTNSTEGFLSLDWEISPQVDSQYLTFQVLFSGENHAGWVEEEISLLQHTNIDASPIAAYVFDEIVLECDYREFFSNNTIDDATITYELEGFSSPLIQEELNPNVYQATLNLGRYNFEPGTYELTYIASRNGYDPQTIHTELTIAPRTVNFELVQNSKNLKPGDELRFTINLEDILGGNRLLSPVDVKISLFSETPQPAKFQNNGYTIYSETANNIDSNHTFIIPIDRSIQEGNYSISVDILSDFYEGSYLQHNVIEIYRPTTNLIYLIVIAPMLGISLILFVANKKRRAKKSIAGIMVMHENGVLIGDKFEENFTEKDSLLISGAITGIIILIKEITGGGLKTIEIDGGYVSILRGEKYWFVLFLRQNPMWIKNNIRKCVKQISSQFGTRIMAYEGIPIQLNLDQLTLKYFDKIIEDEKIDAKLDAKLDISNTMAKEAQLIEDSPYSTSSDRSEIDDHES